MKLSVIIPCFNAARTIGAQLEALAQQNWSQPWEVIVADNGSTDESLRVVERYTKILPNLTLVSARQIRGQAHARNVGARAATGEALAFCDADDEVAPGWLAAMGDALSTFEFVACRIEFEKLNGAWVQTIFQNHPQLHGLQKFRYPPYLAHAGGGTIGVRKSIHQAVGGFDESVPIHEDTDYCFRIQRLGVELQFVPEALLHIRCRDSLSKLMRQALRLSENNVFLYKRYRPVGGAELWRWRSFIADWKNLAFALPHMRSKAGRALWMWHFGSQLGRLIGSIKHHVPPV